METGSEAGRSKDLPPRRIKEPADEPAAVVEHDRPTDEDVGFSTCSTYESCPDSPSSDRYIPMLLIVVCICIQRGNHILILLVTASRE